ncbi:Ras-related protein Rab-21 [Elysia marginata]|uniref:Ras-related protein Rab-21 n=1 Tax=Elysia marginata TaxID=1093978 RepID=A0AAV4J354_9GAST|nr:Ras-related protein Rab-21 [Elysia marginata]
MSGAKVDVKVVLLGKAYAGKTSLVERYIHNRFSGETVPYQNTIGAAFGAKTVCVDNKNVIIGIWDTAGSERYEAMSRIYYRGAKAAIICYDLSDRSSFDRARKLFVVRHNNLEKLCLEGAVEGRRGRGRPRRRWTQDISDWLGFSVREASILAQDRDGFRSAVWEATSYKDPP